MVALPYSLISGTTPNHDDAPVHLIIVQTAPQCHPHKSAILRQHHSVSTMARGCVSVEVSTFAQGNLTANIKGWPPVWGIYFDTASNTPRS
jgi:hypothetical protein